jgi:hypothetical protein
LLACFHADDQSPACRLPTPSGSFCVGNAFRLILHEKTSSCP